MASKENNMTAGEPINEKRKGQQKHRKNKNLFPGDLEHRTVWRLEETAIEEARDIAIDLIGKASYSLRPFGVLP